MLINTKAARGGTLLVALLIAGCMGQSNGTDSPQAGSPQTALPEGHPPTTAPAMGGMPQAGGGIAGVVSETMDGGGYTYARIAFSDGEKWVAGPQTALSVGDTVMVPDLMGMGSFTSGALERTFDDLYFTGGFGTSAQMGATGAAATQFQGVVKQAIPASPYIYLEVTSQDRTFWLAAPEAEVTEGATVGWNGGSLMTDFTSGTLNRTFSEILFVGGVVLVN